MSEYGTTEIQTMLKSERKGVRISDIQAFGTTRQLSDTKLTTPTIIQHLNAIINALQVDGGVGI